MIAYLATPYSHPDKDVEEYRFLCANKALALLMQAGHVIFSPIAMTHTAAKDHKLPGNYEYWHKFNCTFIDACDEVWVLQLEGWQSSKGIAAEITYAQEKCMVIRYWKLQSFGGVVEVDPLIYP